MAALCTGVGSVYFSFCVMTSTIEVGSCGSSSHRRNGLWILFPFGGNVKIVLENPPVSRRHMLQTLFRSNVLGSFGPDIPFWTVSNVTRGLYDSEVSSSGLHSNAYLLFLEILGCLFRSLLVYIRWSSIRHLRQQVAFSSLSHVFCLL